MSGLPQMLTVLWASVCFTSAAASCNIIKKAFGAGADAWNGDDWTFDNKNADCTTSAIDLTCSMLAAGPDVKATYNPFYLQPSAPDHLVVTFSIQPDCQTDYHLNLIDHNGKIPWSLGLSPGGTIPLASHPSTMNLV